jgi:hypothetical protein
MTATETTCNQLAEIYTLMCRAAMNKEYYGAKLARSQSVNTWMDILIAIGTAGSGLSALTIWTTDYGKVVWAVLWAVLSLVSTVLALAKPIVQLNKRVERFSRLFAGHSDIYTGLLVLSSRIRRKGSITDEMNSSFEAAEIRFMELSKEDDPKPDRKLLDRCEQMIRSRHPAQNAWYPSTDAATAASSPASA